jgi:putative colanic acid biosynthesis acetyltransferase WcaF
MSEMSKTDLSKFNNTWYKTGRNFIIRGLWFSIQGILFSSWLPGSHWRRFILRLFGAKIGKNVILKPRIIIKYPWNLQIGDNSWIGEKVWLDNLGKIEIGANCCISQGAFLLCGNHNYKSPSFDLIVNDILLQDGVWIGANCLITSGVICLNHSILTAGSVLTKNTESYGIYSGNPATKVRERIISK